MTAFPLLSSPFRIRNLTLPNRTVMSPMSTGLGNLDGSVSEAQIAFYQARAEGGVGLVIVEFTGVCRVLGLAEVNQLSLDSRENLPGHIRLVKAIRSAGARAALQLHAPGRHCDRKTIEGLPAGPSEEMSKRDGRTPTARALTEAEIVDLVEAYGKSARLAVEAGYEAIEIHGAHGYLPMAFLSPLSNRRDDQWGGDFDRRLRFAEEVIRSIRRAIGPDMPLFYRLSSAEHMPGGLTIEDMERIAPRLAAAGVDCLDVSTGTLAGTLDLTIDPMSMPEGWRFADSRRIRDAAGVPVIGIGPVRWPRTAEDALAGGDADLICLGRPLLADPQWPKKAIAGEIGEIRPCTNCNWCFSRVLEHAPIGCAEAPETGNELRRPPASKGTGRKAVVIGGGPGGMSAAAALSEKGFETHLFEARDRLGGGLISSSTPPLKDKLLWYLRYLEDRVRTSQAVLHLGRPADADAVAGLEPSVVVLANGVLADVLDVPGAAEGSVISAYDMLMGDAGDEIGPSATVAVYGGGETGCESAEYLAGLGHQVILVTRSDRRDLARSAEVMYRKHLVRRLWANTQIEIVDHATILSFHDGRLEVARPDGSSLDRAVDRLVVAQGRKADESLAEALRSHGLTVITIGDAARIGRIGDAVHAADAAIRAILGAAQEKSAPALS